MSTYPWYAIKVRAGAEQRIATALENRGYVSFVPTYMESRPYSDRIKKVQAPLFSGYVFSSLNIETERIPVLQCEGVHNFVGIGWIPQSIPDSVVEALRIISISGIDAEPWPYLRTGDHVIVQHGGLRGVEGQLLQIKGKDRLVLSIELLQRSITVEIDRAAVRLLDAYIDAGNIENVAQMVS